MKSKLSASSPIITRTSFHQTMSFFYWFVCRDDIQTQCRTTQEEEDPCLDGVVNCSRRDWLILWAVVRARFLQQTRDFLRHLKTRQARSLTAGLLGLHLKTRQVRGLQGLNAMKRNRAAQWPTSAPVSKFCPAVVDGGGVLNGFYVFR